MTKILVLVYAEKVTVGHGVISVCQATLTIQIVCRVIVLALVALRRYVMLRDDAHVWIISEEGNVQRVWPVIINIRNAYHVTVTLTVHQPNLARMKGNVNVKTTLMERRARVVEKDFTISPLAKNATAIQLA